MQKLTRSLHTYLNVKLGVRSPSHRRIAKTALDNFSIFLKEYHQTTPDKIISDFMDHETAFDVLQAWINWTSKKEIATRNGTKTGKYPTARTINVYFQHIKNYLHYMGVKFHPDDIRHELDLPTVLEYEKHGVKLDEIKKILSEVRIKKKALYLAQISSGMRIGELVQLRKRHLDFTKTRIMVKIPPELAKKRRGRTTFFSKEFEKLYKFELDKLENNDLIFVKNENWEYARENETQYLQEVCKRIGLSNITTHSFRAYFITKISRLDPNLAKLFAGQKGYLLQYDRLDDEEKLEKYIEFEPELLVFETKNNSKNIKDLENRIKTYEKMMALSQLNDLKLEQDEFESYLVEFERDHSNVIDFLNEQSLNAMRKRNEDMNNSKK